MTLIGTHIGTDVYAGSQHDFTTRQLAGDRLTNEVIVFGTQKCDGSNQAGKECLRAQSHHEKTLDDGTLRETGCGSSLPPEGTAVEAVVGRLATQEQLLDSEAVDMMGTLARSWTSGRERARGHRDLTGKLTGCHGVEFRH